MAYIERAKPAGGGGAGLNFKVVGGLTQPTSPTENTVWVKTDIPIGEYQFGANEPTTRADGSALVEGDIWICIGTTVPTQINMLKNNGIMVTVVNVKQYSKFTVITDDSSFWVNTNFGIYQNGKWNNSNYLYRMGNLCTELTGGWSTAKYSSDAWHTSGVTLSKAAESLKLTISSDGQNACGSFFTTNKIDLTNYSKLCAEVTVTASASTYNVLIFGAYSAKPTSSDRGTSAKTKRRSTGTKKIIEVDISDLTGSYYITSQLFKYSGWGETKQTAKVHNVWLI